MSLAEQVEKALESVSVKPEDAGTTELALTYAREIDLGGDLTKLGPSLLGALEALQMSPRARAVAARGGKTDDKPTAGRLDELRQRRARKSRAATVDEAAPGPV